MSSSSETPNSNLFNYLKILESRISRIETHLNLQAKSTEEDFELKPPVSMNRVEASDALEFRIGEFWTAKIGIIVLAIGIVFLLTFPYQNLPPALPSLFGYMLVATTISLSHFWRNSYSLISRYLLGGALVLLYFTTLRLYFFSEQPVITNKSIELTLLLFVVIINLIVSVRRNSPYLSSITLTLGYSTALIGGWPIFVFITLCILSTIIVYFKLKYDWPYLFIYGIILTYLTHLLWFVNNPFLGNKIQLVTSPQINIFFILLYAVIFALGNFLREKIADEDNLLIISTFLNSFGCYALYLLITLTKFQDQFALSHLLASVLFLLLSVIFWVREKSKYSTFFYAIIGYTALSVAIVSQFERPDFFIWLSWQSILVITTAIWFRSKFIVVANFIIFLIIFISYLIVAGEVSIVSLSFGVAALFSARILNWKKHRLELKTELMRNAYLTSAFFIFPYALYHLVPGGYVGLSWVAVSVFYYLLSIVLKNKKYRWMALMTLLLTALYIFIFGIIKLEALYRIISFLVLAIVLLAMSLIYTRMRAKKNPDDIDMS